MNWQAKYLVSEAPNSSEYRVEYRSHGDWSAQWAGPPPSHYGEHVERWVVNIDARDDLGTHDWPSQELAMAACANHAAFMDRGFAPQDAADRVAEDFRAEELAERALEDSHAAHVDSDETLGLVRS